ncbi:2805_t:CDS:10 [Ambispora leptoticha]|uniref:Nonsense-mediated mRNA decay factor SMG8 n=1 Tax=Ambispora leptoticha TaxID=144679 RepID=A0A9N9BE85_9GLOM|nr:2805_t:CDS:10 [Ambispora leptoticha]
MEDSESISSEPDVFIQEINETLRRTRLNDASLVSVVAFVGFTRSGTTPSMASVANAILERNIFGQTACCVDQKCNCTQKRASLLIGDDNNHGLWIYTDHKKNTIYLLLDSINEWASFLQIWEKIDGFIENGKEFQDWLWKREHLYMRMLVFMFMVSHVVMLSLPISKLDSNMISLLRIVSSVKRHILSHASNFINTCWQNWGIPSPYGSTSGGGYGGRGGTPQGGTMAPGRSVPFLLFLFQEVQLPVVTHNDSNKSDTVHDKSASISIKRIKDALQARVRFLFRTCHLVQTNDLHASFDGRQLFTLPPPSSQFFVHLITRGSTGNMLSTDPALVILSASINSDRNDTIDIEGLLKRRRLDARSTENFEIKLLRDFAIGWIKWAGTGYPRSFVKRGIASSELPDARQWVSGIIALKRFLFGQLPKELIDRKASNLVEDTLTRRLKDCVQINNRFSASHCAQVLRKAVDVYLLESPTYYTKQYHEIKLEHALGFYMSSARGPCVQEYAQKLRLECQNIWEHGRQKCEYESLTGHQCVLGANHDTDSKTDDEVKKFVKHRSAFQTLHACNCGRTRREREDPFDLMEANVIFFKFDDCCQTEDDNLFHLPLVKNKSSDKSMWSLIHLGSNAIYDPKVGLDKWDGFVTNANFLLPWNIIVSEHNQEDTTQVKDVNGLGTDAADLHNINGEVEEKDISILQKKETFNVDVGKITINDSTDWPLLTSESTAQSWMAQSEFNDDILHSNENVQQISRDANNFQSSSRDSKNGDYLKDKRSRRNTRTAQKKEREKTSASTLLNNQNFSRGYVGVEYECPNGHRFMSCGDGQVCKRGHINHTQESAKDLLDKDLPIFILCPCNNTLNGPPTITAQLQRIIIITPDSHLSVILNPSIKDSNNQDVEVSPIVNLDDKQQTQINEIILPSNSMTVLRLPYPFFNNQSTSFIVAEKSIMTSLQKISSGSPIKVDKDITKRLSSLYLAKNFIIADKRSSLPFKEEEASSITRKRTQRRQKIERL